MQKQGFIPKNRVFIEKKLFNFPCNSTVALPCHNYDTPPERGQMMSGKRLAFSSGHFTLLIQRFLGKCLRAPWIIAKFAYLLFMGE